MYLRNYGFDDDEPFETPVNGLAKSDIPDYDPLTWAISELELNEYRRRGQVSFDYADIDISQLSESDQHAFFAYLHKKHKYYTFKKNNVIRVAVAEGGAAGFFTRYFVNFGDYGLMLPFVIPIILCLIYLSFQ